MLFGICFVLFCFVIASLDFQSFIDPRCEDGKLVWRLKGSDEPVTDRRRTADQSIPVLASQPSDFKGGSANSPLHPLNVADLEENSISTSPINKANDSHF